MKGKGSGTELFTRQNDMTITPQTLLRFVAGAAIAAVALFLVWYFRSIVIYILVSAVLAIMGRPLVKVLTRLHVQRWHMPRGLAAAVTLLVIWVVFVGLCAAFVPLVSAKVYQLSHIDFGAVVSTIEEPLHAMQTFLSATLPAEMAETSLREMVVAAMQSILERNMINTAVTSLFGLFSSSVIAFFSISFITFFFLKEDGLFYAMVTSIFPEKYQQNVHHALDSITVLLSRYFTGILTESFLLMMAVSLAMMAFGMQSGDAFFIGLVMGVMNVVPYAGPVIGGMIAVSMGIITPIEGMTVGRTMFIIAGTLLILKGMDDFILQPTLYSERVKAHPLEVFLVILIAGSLAGVVGMLLAIPMYTVLRVFAKEFFSQISLVRKLTRQI